MAAATVTRLPAATGWMTSANTSRNTASATTLASSVSTALTLPSRRPSNAIPEIRSGNGTAHSTVENQSPGRMKRPPSGPRVTAATAATALPDMISHRCSQPGDATRCRPPAPPLP